MNPEEIEALFLAKIKPYEDRILKLEEAEKTKELEIISLKHAIQNLHRIIETLKTQVKAPAGKPPGKPAAAVDDDKKPGKPAKPASAAPKKEGKDGKDQKKDDKKKPESKKGT